MTTVATFVEPGKEADDAPKHVIRRGLRVLARFVRLNPVPFSIAIVL